VVGLAAEARLLSPLPCPVAIGGGTPAGARAAAERLVAEGATALVSFGLAGGLDPALPTGTLLVPVAVVSRGIRLAIDPALAAALGGVTRQALVAAEEVVATTAAKARLWRGTGCAGVDLESGAVAEVARDRGLAFAVLRAICDPGTRGLPPAALAALDAQGRIAIGRVLAALARHPGQLPALLALAREAATARRALAARVAALAGREEWRRRG
jgi:adenosylhomocysteine nucleosidase